MPKITARSWWRRRVWDALPIAGARFAEGFIARQIEDISAGAEAGEVPTGSVLQNEVLERLLDDLRALKANLEAKATMHIGGAGLVVSLLATNATGLGRGAGLLVLLSAAYFFMAAACAFDAVRPRAWAHATLLSELQLLDAAAHDPLRRHDELAFRVRINEKLCSIIANHIGAAHKSSVYGLALLLGALVALTFGEGVRLSLG